MNLINRGSAPESGRRAREGRLLALFNARPDAATAVDVALRRHGAETISIEREWIDDMQAIRAAWPVAAQGSMNETWLRQVLRSVDPGERDIVRASLGTTQRVAIFVSRRDHCIADLMQRSRTGTLPCEIALIVSNHEDCRPLAELYGVPYHCFDLARRSKESVEADQLALVESQRVDLIVLARYMQILSPAFVERYPGRIINIHHALLPAFAGANPYQRALERGVKFIGATAHYVTATLDAGPIIEQEVLRVSHRDDAEALRRKGADLERMTLTRAVHLHRRGPGAARERSRGRLRRLRRASRGNSGAPGCAWSHARQDRRPALADGRVAAVGAGEIAARRLPEIERLAGVQGVSLQRRVRAKRRR